MTCRECSDKPHARGLCRSHYSAWYRKHRDEVRRESDTSRHYRKWKFTAEHWWSWWEKRTPDLHTLERRASINALRRGLR